MSVPSPELEAARWKEQGNTHYTKLQLQEALVCYSNAVCLDPGNPVYRGNRSAVYYSIGKYEHCIDDILTALSLTQENNSSGSGGGDVLSNKLKTRLTMCAIISGRIDVLDKISLGEDQETLLATAKFNRTATRSDPESSSQASDFLCSKVKFLRLPVAQSELLEYYFSGHDQATSAFEELHEYLCKNGSPYPIDIKTLKSGTDLDVCYFGIGDGRHLFKTLSHIYDEIDEKLKLDAKMKDQHNTVCMKKKKKGKNRYDDYVNHSTCHKIDHKFRFTLNDIQPMAIARLIILFLQLLPLTEKRSSESPPSPSNGTATDKCKFKRFAFIKEAVAITQSFCNPFVFHTVYDDLMHLIEQCAKSPEYYLSRLPFLRIPNQNSLNQIQAAFKHLINNVPTQSTKQLLATYAVTSSYPLLKMHLVMEAMKDPALREDYEKRQKQEKIYVKALVTSIPDPIVSVLVSEPGSNSIKEKRVILANKIQSHFDHDLNVLELLHSPSHVIVQSIFLYESKLLPLPYDYPLILGELKEIEFKPIDVKDKVAIANNSTNSNDNNTMTITNNNHNNNNNNNNRNATKASSQSVVPQVALPAASPVSNLISGIRHLYGHADLGRATNKNIKTLKDICESHAEFYKGNPLCFVLNNYEAACFNPLECMVSIKEKINPHLNLDKQMEKMMQKEDIYGIFLDFFWKAAQVIHDNDVTVELNVNEMSSFAYEIMENKEQRIEQGLATEYNRIWMSNIPDYTGIILPILSVEGLLKRDKDMIDVDEEIPRSHTSSCNLFNCNLWKDYNHYLYSSCAIADVDQFKRLLGIESANSDLRDYQNWCPVIPDSSYTDVYGYKQWDITLKDELKDWLLNFFFVCCCPAKRQFEASMERNSANMNQFFLVIDYLSMKGVPSHWLSSILSDILVQDIVAALPPLASPTSKELQVLAKKRGNAAHIRVFKEEFRAALTLWTSKPSFPLVFNVKLPNDVRTFLVGGLSLVPVNQRMGITNSLGLAIRAIATKNDGSTQSSQSTRDQVLSGSKDLHLFSILDYVHADSLKGDGANLQSEEEYMDWDDSVHYSFIASNAFIEEICNNTTKSYVFELYRLDNWDKISASLPVSSETVKPYFGDRSYVETEQRLKRLSRKIKTNSPGDALQINNDNIDNVIIKNDSNNNKSNSSNNSSSNEKRKTDKSSAKASSKSKGSVAGGGL